MKIVVLAGGLSTERDVSLVSGKKIYDALKENGHKVILLDVFLGLKDSDLDTVFDRGDELLDKKIGIGLEAPDLETIKKQRDIDPSIFFGENVIEICKKADVVFMALHGQNGENGKIQAVFDLHGIRYTGADYLSSAICMDKALTKDLLKLHGINVPQGYKLSKGENDAHEIQFPVVVKVKDGGSSVGVYIAHNKDEFVTAKEKAFTFEDQIIVEEYVKGREFSVGLIEGKALPVIEITTDKGFYDYIKKYQEGSVIETCPAELDKEKTEEMQALVEKAYQILRLTQYARIDVIMKNSGDIYILEANTLPGMTPTSLMPQEAMAIGMNFNQFCEKIIEIAMKKS